LEHTGATSICHVTMAGKNLRTPDELAISWTNRRDSEWSPKSKVRSPVVSLVECHILFMGTIPLHKFAASTLGHTSGQVIDP